MNTYNIIWCRIFDSEISVTQIVSYKASKTVLIYVYINSNCPTLLLSWKQYIKELLCNGKVDSFFTSYHILWDLFRCLTRRELHALLI